MLHLTRKPGEEIWLNVGGVSIVVRILEIRRTLVDLGIIAPLEVAILRPDAKVQEPKRSRVRYHTNARCGDCHGPLEVDRDAVCHLCCPPGSEPIPILTPPPVSPAAKIVKE